jgi:AraC family transcriptional regulator, transcriptional activator of pobA
MHSPLSVVEHANQTASFRIFDFTDAERFCEVQRNSCYIVVWIFKGDGVMMSDISRFSFNANSLFSFSPYQAFSMQAENKIEGLALLFHPDFFCIHKHQREVACDGVLFNNLYQPPFIVPDIETSAVLKLLTEQMKDEFNHSKLARNEVLLSYLKVFLIAASRFKKEKNATSQLNVAKANLPVMLQKLKDDIENNFKDKRSASEYAAMLHISVKALAKMTKTYFNKTISELIAGRVIIEAKRELYLTNKTVKEIARDLGYEDEYYFSRFFKIHVDVSPQTYRQTIGFGKGVA